MKHFGGSAQSTDISTKHLGGSAQDYFKRLEMVLASLEIGRAHV